MLLSLHCLSMRDSISYVYIEWSNNKFLLECVGGYIPHPETDTAISPRGHEDPRLSPSLGTELSTNNHHKMYAPYRQISYLHSM